MFGKVRKNIELNAVVFPPCVSCGAPYRPTKPIVDHGTVFFQSPDRLANILYRIERFFANIRLKRLGQK